MDGPADPAARHALVKSFSEKPKPASAALPHGITQAQVNAALYRRYAPRWLRLEVLARDRYRCRYCGRKVTNATANMDHVKPWPGGMTELSNLVTACHECNMNKRSSEARMWADRRKNIDARERAGKLQ